MEKLSEIFQDIPKNKWIKHLFDVERGTSGIFEQKIAIQSQNVLSCIEFLMSYLSFQYNQMYKLYYVYNQNKDRVYNEIHIGN